VDEHGEIDVRAEIGAALLGATVYELAPGKSVCAYHWHVAEEEWLLVLSGEPTVRMPHGDRTLREGDVLVFPVGEEGAHAVRNDSDAPVRVVMFSNRAEVEIAVYPDSDKVGVWGGGIHVLNRVAANLDYWDGEQR
jgi:uncharacterized cupin superfamily protein